MGRAAATFIGGGQFRIALDRLRFVRDRAVEVALRLVDEGAGEISVERFASSLIA